MSVAETATLYYKVPMRTRLIAFTELVLIFPAALFMSALLLRGLQPLQYEPALTAQQLVMWYAGRMWTLWVLLVGFPFAVVITGCAALLGRWNGDATAHTARESLAKVRGSLARRFIAATTLAAAVILAIVVLHILAN